MNLDQKIKDFGLVRYILMNGGKIAPLELYYENNDILSSMNPSIYIDDNDIAYINIRAVNYNLFAVNTQEITCDDQPTIYVGADQTKLITTNFFGTINLDTLEINNIYKVDTSNFDKEPQWDFIGLEDARIIKWNNNIYLCGVRRDVKSNGEGRMELSKIEFINNNWVEVERTRMPCGNDNDDSYCEKNWMPVLNKEYTWVNNIREENNGKLLCKISNFDINTQTTTNRFTKFISKNDPQSYYRGNSQVVQYGDYYYCIVHFVYYEEYINRSRQAKYVSYIVKFDLDLNVIDVSDEFLFSNDFTIEFGCGLAIKNNIAYITYSEDDSASYIIKFPANLLFN